MSDLTWQEAAPGDESALLAMMNAFYAEDHLAFDAARARAAVRELLATPAHGRILLLRDTAPEARGYLVLTVGFSLEFGGRFALLDEFYVAPALRGRGLGRQALDVVATWTRAQGIATVRLEVTHTNPRARALYLTAGFADDRRDLLTRWL